MTFIGPKNKEIAVRLLDAASKAGLPSSAVKTVNGGFEVPEEVVEIFEAKPKRKAASKSKAEAVPEADDKKEGND